MMQPQPILIGADGGGTSCRIALCAGLDGPRHEVLLGPANVSTDPEAAIATLIDGLAAVAGRAGLTPEDLGHARAHFGLAGVMTAGIAARVAARMPLRRLTVTDDRPTTIAGALHGADGTVAAIGTGSFIGRQVAGAITGVGGWGLQLGDQASAAWLGRRCLEEVLLAVDGLAPTTDLVRTVLTAQGGDTNRIVAFSMSARPFDYAAVSRDVVAAADAGDPLGARLLRDGAAYITSAITALGWQPGETLCLTGGLGSAYATRLGLPVQPPRGTALDGALLLAAKDGGGRA